MMITFDSNRVNNWRNFIQKLAREFEEQELRLTAIINGLEMEIAARNNIDMRLDTLRRRARELREGLEGMAGLLSRAEAAYGDADRQIAEMVRRLTEEWKESERTLAPILSRARLGLTRKDVEQIDAIRALDGLFMNNVNYENHTAHFKPLNIRFEVLPDEK